MSFILNECTQKDPLYLCGRESNRLYICSFVVPVRDIQDKLNIQDFFHPVLSSFFRMSACFPSSPAMAIYTCIACRVAFKDAEVQRAHYKTDWHRYNLKRKVADMPPVTAENFQERVLAQRAGLEEQSKATATYCTACSKRFSNFSSYENHLKSKKHIDLEKKAVQAVSKQVELLNEKNLEKGLAQENVDKDAVNAAIQQAIKAQPSSSPKKAPLQRGDAPGASLAAESSSSLRNREHVDKPPRLQWFQQQAKKLAKQESGDEGDDEDLEEGNQEKSSSFWPQR